MAYSFKQVSPLLDSWVMGAQHPPSCPRWLSSRLQRKAWGGEFEKFWLSSVVGIATASIVELSGILSGQGGSSTGPFCGEGWEGRGFVMEARGGFLHSEEGGSHCPHADFCLWRQSCLCVENSREGGCWMRRVFLSFLVCGGRSMIRHLSVTHPPATSYPLYTGTFGHDIRLCSLTTNMQFWFNFHLSFLVLHQSTVGSWWVSST